MTKNLTLIRIAEHTLRTVRLRRLANRVYGYGAWVGRSA